MSNPRWLFLCPTCGAECEPRGEDSFCRWFECPECSGIFRPPKGDPEVFGGIGSAKRAVHLSDAFRDRLRAKSKSRTKRKAKK